jgi:S-DNA-T family DNA segregation ATPase FtsK/SpoIIIE
MPWRRCIAKGRVPATYCRLHSTYVCGADNCSLIKSTAMAKINDAHHYPVMDDHLQNPPFPTKLSKLIQEAGWILRGLFLVYLVLILATYSRADPGWTYSVATVVPSNWGGRLGSWLSDLLLFLAGVSAWWLCILLIRPVWPILSKTGPAPSNYVVIAVSRSVGFIMLLAGSSGIESIRMQSMKLALPGHPGGVLGTVVGGSAQTYLGVTGGTLFLMALLATGVSLFFQLSWFTAFDSVRSSTHTWMNWMKNRVGAWLDRRAGQIAVQAREAAVQQRDPTPAPSEAPRVEPIFDASVETTAHVAPVHTLPDIDIRPTDQAPGVSPPLDTAFIEPQLPAQPLVQAPAVLTPSAVESNVVHMADIVRASTRTTAPAAVVIEPDDVDLATSLVNPTPIRKGSIAIVEPSETCLPQLTLLDPAPATQETISAEVLEQTSRLIERKLADFGVNVTVVAAWPGPVVTRYEIDPATGVKGSQIVGLARDLARALSLTSVRVVETIPGKNYMGLELPNARRQIVRLTEILGSKAYNDGVSSLTVALGKDIAGNAVVADLAKMPHLLVAGTTGSGKSVGINATILSLLFKSDPSEVRMILIDPKMLELSIYEGIPHLLAPVVTDMRQAEKALTWAVAEMERRYKLMSKMGVRNLAGYNTKISDAHAIEASIPNPFSLTPDDPEPLARLPTIVIVIDELADLMMVVGKKVEELIARIAQKARAAGVHLILATQRPSVDVITGLIKANIPTRIAFQVSSKIDSRTILDQMGAEALLGMGDMLYLPPGTGVPIRVHGAFVSDEEVHRVVDYLKSQGEPAYIEGILEGGTLEEEGGASSGAIGDSGESDALYDQAVAIVLKNRRASISLVQRHLRIGYNRAARLLEQMERSGVVSTMQSNGNRDILVPASAPD